jgi:hypothetical protein
MELRRLPANCRTLRGERKRRRPPRSALAALAGATLLAAGCATVVHRPLSGNEDDADRGIRYYNSSPYVLVYANAAGGITAQIEYLPDPYKLMSAKPTQWLSSLDTRLEFTNGVLTQADTTADTSVVPEAILTAAKTAATSILARTSEDPSKPEVPAPLLFKIVQARNGEYLLVGGAADPPFRLTIGGAE